MKKIKVLIKESYPFDGSIELTPVVKKYARQYAKLVKDNGGPNLFSNSFTVGGEFTGVVVAGAFLQGESGIEFVKTLTRKQKRELDFHRHITAMMDPWELGLLYGYDASNINLS
jgi:hypothetical protein